MIRCLLVINHFLDQVNFTFESFLRGRIAILRTHLSSHLADSLHLCVGGLATCLVEAITLVERAVAERRRVVLGRATMRHLPDDASVNQAIGLVHFVNNAVLVVSDGLGVEVVLDGAALSKFVVAGVHGLLSWQQSLTPINNGVLCLNSLLAIEVENFLVGAHVELVSCWQLGVFAPEAGHVLGVFTFDGLSVGGARHGGADAALSLVLNWQNGFFKSILWWVISVVERFAAVVVESSGHRLAVVGLVLTLVQHGVMEVPSSVLEVFLCCVLMSNCLAPASHLCVGLSFKSHFMK